MELQKFIVLDLIKVELCKHQFYILNYEEKIMFKCKYLIRSHLKMRKKREESCEDYLFINLDLKLKKLMES